MVNKETLLEQLSSLLKWKESKAFMANRLNISLGELNELLMELRNETKPIVRREEQVSEADAMLMKVNMKEGYVVAGGWLKEDGISVRFSKSQDKESQTEKFKDFLKTFTPKENVIEKDHHAESYRNACLVINVQDAHYNKHDINGKNNIFHRMSTVRKKMLDVVLDARKVCNLNKIIYVLGSDIFNSEWTDMTTKGTPQTNVASYQDGFQIITQGEIDTIEYLLHVADNVEVVFCPGNHDEHVGWHLVSFLQMYFRNQKNITFDISPKYTKYIKYSNSAICFNHGDGAKPEVIAQNFPMAFKEYWSKCDHFYIFGGDKHTELSRDLGGIKFYRIPALSSAQSKWDSKNGYEAKAELTAFLIEESEGMTNIMKRLI